METPEAPRGAPASAFPQPDEHGNYHPPPLVAMRRVWADYQADIATREDVEIVLQAVTDFALAQLESLKAQVERGQSDPDDPIFQSIQEAFEKNLEAVDIMEAEFDHPDQGYFEDGLDLAQEASNDLMAAHLKLMQSIEAMGQVCCIFCGQSNPRGTDRCGRCGRSLPAEEGEPERSSFSAVAAAEGSGPEAKVEVTENYMKVEQAIRGFRDRTIEADDALGVLEEVEDRLLAHQSEVGRQRGQISQVPEEAQEALLAAIDLTAAALEMNLAAVEKLLLALPKDDELNLELGLQDMYQAAAAMVRAYYATKAVVEGSK